MQISHAISSHPTSNQGKCVQEQFVFGKKTRNSVTPGCHIPGRISTYGRARLLDDGIRDQTRSRHRTCSIGNSNQQQHQIFPFERSRLCVCGWTNWKYTPTPCSGVAGSAGLHSHPKTDRSNDQEKVHITLQLLQRHLPPADVGQEIGHQMNHHCMNVLLPQPLFSASVALCRKQLFKRAVSTRQSHWLVMSRNGVGFLREGAAPQNCC